MEQVREQLEIKRMKRLEKKQIVNVMLNGRVRRAKIVHNFKNANVIDLKIQTFKLPFWMIETESKPYEWTGFDITLKEDLI